MSMPALRSFSADRSEPREPFAAFVLDEATMESLVPIASDRGWDTSRIQGGGIANAVRSLAVAPPPHLLIVDLSESEEPRADITALAEVCEPGTIVIALGAINDVSLYRDLIATGIYDYLVKPVTSDQLRQAIATAEEMAQAVPTEEPVPVESGRVTTFIGARGGVGTSTLAINSAWVMAHDLGRKVALVDLDIHYGTAALAFDLEPGRGLYDALENPGRVDGLFIERAMVKESDNLWILSGEAPIGEALTPHPTALDHLLGELKTNFRDVVIDLPRTLVGQEQFLLSESRHIVLVSDFTLTSIRDVIRLLAFARQVAPEVEVTVVGNRYQGAGRDEVSQKDFENAIEHKIDLIVPNDWKSVVAASKAAKTIPEINRASRAAAAIRNLASNLAGGEQAPKKSLWQRLGLRK